MRVCFSKTKMGEQGYKCHINPAFNYQRYLQRKMNSGIVSNPSAEPGCSALFTHLYIDLQYGKAELD